MTALEEQLTNGLKDIVYAHQMVIDELHFKRRGKEQVLEIFVEREDYSSIDLDAIVALSEELSPRLDELNLIQENYCLDVSTSGTEKPIKDFSKFPKLVGKYMEIHLKNPIRGINIFQGTLENVEENRIIITYKNKTRVCKEDIELDNILKAKLTAKI